MSTKNDFWLIGFDFYTDDYDELPENGYPDDFLERFDYFFNELGRDFIEVIAVDQKEGLLVDIPSSLAELNIDVFSNLNETLREFWVLYQPPMSQYTVGEYEYVWHTIQDASEGVTITAIGPIDRDGPLVLQTFVDREFDDGGYFENPGDDDNYRDISELPEYVQRAISE